MTTLKFTRRAVLMIPLLAIAAMAAVYRIDSRPDAGVSIHPQDLNGLDRRIGLMEQRFYAARGKGEST